MPINSGNDCIRGSPISAFAASLPSLHLLLDQPKALVSSESYHYQYSREQNGWSTEAVHSSPVVKPFWRRKFEGNLFVCVCVCVSMGLLSMVPYNQSFSIHLSRFVLFSLNFLTLFYFSPPFLFYQIWLMIYFPVLLRSGWSDYCR